MLSKRTYGKKYIHFISFLFNVHVNKKREIVNKIIYISYNNLQSLKGGLL